MKLLPTVLLALAWWGVVLPAWALTPGPTIIRQCPGCKQGSREFIIRSGNTAGAKWWTDGVGEVPALSVIVLDRGRGETGGILGG
jgi:hypothetical protein